MAFIGGNISIHDNAALPTCEATAMVSQLVALGWNGMSNTSGNDEGGVCD